MKIIRLKSNILALRGQIKWGGNDVQNKKYRPTILVNCREATLR